MQLDRTRIAIRERSFLDILDLSLRMIVAFGGPLFLGLAAVIVPMMIVNFLLIGWMTQIGDEIESYARYLWTMTLLVVIQARLVSIFVTPFLGNAMFLEDVGPRVILQVVRQSAGGLILNMLLLRRSTRLLATGLVDTSRQRLYGLGSLVDPAGRLHAFVSGVPSVHQ